MSKRNAIARPAENHEELRQPGAYRLWSHDFDSPSGANVGCPCGCGRIYGFRWRASDPRLVVWSVTGEWPNVTVSPSLNFMDVTDPTKSHWHGFLRNGVFEEC